MLLFKNAAKTEPNDNFMLSEPFPTFIFLPTETYFIATTTSFSSSVFVSNRFYLDGITKIIIVC